MSAISPGAWTPSTPTSTEPVTPPRYLRYRTLRKAGSAPRLPTATAGPVAPDLAPQLDQGKGGVAQPASAGITPPLPLLQRRVKSSTALGRAFTNSEVPPVPSLPLLSPISLREQDNCRSQDPTWRATDHSPPIVSAPASQLQFHENKSPISPRTRFAYQFPGAQRPIQLDWEGGIRQNEERVPAVSGPYRQHEDKRDLVAPEECRDGQLALHATDPPALALAYPQLQLQTQTQTQNRTQTTAASGAYTSPISSSPPRLTHQVSLPPNFSSFDWPDSTTYPDQTSEDSPPTSPPSSASMERFRFPSLGLRRSPKQFIEPGGKGIVPQFDAPKSASNASDRRVTVRCMHSSIAVAVTPETTSVEILGTSAELVANRINPETSVVVENFLSLGLERRLRRFERIRDVMNSWDYDSQNSLVALPSNDATADLELDVRHVPITDNPPPGFCLYIYCCSRVGRWNKRYITLLENGQLICSKKQNAKLGEKDTTTLCHLSDFDIYTPTERQRKKTVKPPKRFCYAIKSQEKIALFESNGNYLHFFSMDDPATATQFWSLVHGWRSWYLVNKKMVTRKPIANPALHHAPPVSLGTGRVANGLSRAPSHRSRRSVDGSVYRGYQPEPLVDLCRTNTSNLADGARDDALVARPSRYRKKDAAPSRDRSNTLTSQKLAEIRRDADFDSNGLLGSAYDERKENMKVSSSNPTHAEAEIHGPFTEGSLLNGGVLRPPEPMPDAIRIETRGRYPPSAGAHPPGDSLVRQRSRSRAPSVRSLSQRPLTSDDASIRHRDLPPPLLDLTPQGPEVPAQWREKGGHGIRAPTGVPLVQMATTPQQQAHQIPSFPSRSMSRHESSRPATDSRRSREQSRRTDEPGQPLGSRMRSRSVTTSSRPMALDMRYPVPAIPTRMATERFDDSDDVVLARGRDSRPREGTQLGRSVSTRYHR